MNPACQMELCKDPDDCIFGKYPSLDMLNETYGNKFATAWLIPQLTDLSEYCGVRDKLQGKSLEECAFTIATGFKFLKTSEILLFFHKFKEGKYGRFYGNIDPLVITTSLNQFVEDRNNAIYEHDKELREKERTEWSKTSVSREEYDAMVKMTIEWKTRDAKFIHNIQRYFGMEQKITVNYRSDCFLKEDDSRWDKLKEGEQKGFYHIIYQQKS